MAQRQATKTTAPRIYRKKPSFEVLWMLPAVTILLIITIYPTFYMLYMSTIEYSLLPGVPSKFIGIGNWISIFSDKAIWNSLVTTIFYFVFALSLQITLGTAIAILIEHSPYFKDVIATALLFPMYLAPVVVGLLWRFMLHDSYGVYTYFLRSTGLLDRSISLLGNTRTAMGTVILMDTWEWTPLIMIIVQSGLRALPVDITEAAEVDQEPLSSSSCATSRCLSCGRYLLLPFVLNWNGWLDTVECLESLFGVFYPCFDVVVVDNASEDDSVSRIREYCQGNLRVESPFFTYTSENKPIKLTEITEDQINTHKNEGNSTIDSSHDPSAKQNELLLIRNRENHGFAVGNNIAMEFALAEFDPDYILLLNNDTAVDPQFLDEMIKATGDKIGIISPKLLNYDDPQPRVFTV